jgi:beta-galactosidase
VFDGGRSIAGFTVDEGVIAQLMLSYLAAGFKGFGFWCWNSRSAGWEAGEYAMLDRQNQPTPRAIQAGRIGQAAQRYRDELWQAHKEPMVGLLVDFDNDAMWAAISLSGRDRFKHFPMQARVGAARALIDHNVPWEHVTASDLRNGLARRYKTIYLPGIISLGTDLLTILAQYVEAGGRVVIDAPSCWYNEFGRLVPTGPGTTFEKTFGCSIRDFQYSSNVPRSLDGRRMDGFVLDLALTHAGTVAKFDNGQPAITEAKVGAGTAVVLGFEASMMCFRPGNAAAEDLLVRQLLGTRRPGYFCAGAIVYRLAAPQADHYFLINDGPATAVRLQTPGHDYSAAIDAITQEPVGLGAAIDLPPYGGRWLRLTKASEPRP